MAIYGRFGHELTIERRATIDDIRPLTGRKPDKTDREHLERDAYVIVKDKGGKRELYHVGYLRADNGWAEISDAIEASQ